MLYSLMQISRRIRGQLSEAVGRFKDPRAVQGVRLEYDAYWLKQLLKWVSSTGRWPPFHPEEYGHWAQWYEKFLERPESFVPPFWHDYVKANRLGKGNPVIITFVLRDPKAVDEFAESIQGTLSGFQARAEYRPQARGYTTTAASVKIAPETVGVSSPHQTDGTLGGVVKDRSRPSKQYIVSCAHVLTDTVGADVYVPSPLKGGKSVVAKLSYGVMPPPVSAGVSCSKETTSEYPLDAAAAEISKLSKVPSVALPKVNGVKPIKLMSQSDLVWFTGASSGRVKGQIHSLSIWHEIEIDKQLHCFGNLFIVEPPKPWYLNINLAQPGDSGAWILSTDSFSVDWNGMLVGGDGALVYCSFAEKIMDEFQNAGIDAVV